MRNEVEDVIVRYVNRLSDYLFVLGVVGGLEGEWVQELKINPFDYD
ncbi:MAG: hypothetical protein ACLTZT_16155 [Butyricimonas faecalis]